MALIFVRYIRFPGIVCLSTFLFHFPKRCKQRNEISHITAVPFPVIRGMKGMLPVKIKGDHYGHDRNHRYIKNWIHHILLGKITSINLKDMQTTFPNRIDCLH